MPVLHLDGFDGPMDLLLDLAERQRIDLGRISMLALVEQFVAAWMASQCCRRAPRRLAGARDPPRAAAFAAAVPGHPEAAAEAEREAAREIERLDALRFVRAAAAWLQARPQLGHDVFARPRRGRTRGSRPTWR